MAVGETDHPILSYLAMFIIGKKWDDSKNELVLLLTLLRQFLACSRFAELG